MEIVRTGRVTGRQTEKNKDGVDTVRLLQVVVTDRDDVQTVQLVSQTGEESNPPDGSAVVLVPAGPALKLAVAMLDRVAPDLAVGGKRIYSTAADGQTVMAEVRLDPDGKITIHNDNASQTIDPDGTITVANPGATITITPAGLVTIDADGETVINSSKTTINNDVQINGNLDVSGTATAPNVVGTTDVTAGGISGKNHVHPENDNGGPTGPPQ
jgi:phage gp45-like